MRSVGLRAEPAAFNWAVAEGTQETPILLAVDRVPAPKGYSDPEVLNHFRTRLLHIIEAHHPSRAGMRTPESISRGGGESARRRLRTEGVLLAVSAEAGLDVTFGALVTISKLLGSKAKSLLDSDGYRGIEWAKYNQEKREAILMSASLLPGER